MSGWGRGIEEEDVVSERIVVLGRGCGVQMGGWQWGRDVMLEEHGVGMGGDAGEGTWCWNGDVAFGRPWCWTPPMGKPSSGPSRAQQQGKAAQHGGSWCEVQRQAGWQTGLTHH